MKLLFKQRVFSWFDSYDIYDEFGNVVFRVKGQLSWGHCLKIYDEAGNKLGKVKEKVLAFLPKFELYVGAQHIGCIRKKITLLKPKFQIGFNGWSVKGNWMEWDYIIRGPRGEAVAVISKQLLHFTDTYVIELADEQDALEALMVVLAIDAEKCSRD